MLDLAAKKRLTGAAVLVALAVIFLPMLLEENDDQEAVPEAALRVPEPPPIPAGQAEIFSSADEAALHPAYPPEGEGASASADEPEAEPEAEPEPSTEPAPLKVTKAPESVKATAASNPKSERTRTEPARAKAPPPKPVPAGLDSWVVQVAAMGTPEAAERVKGDLLNKGFTAYIEKQQGQTRTLWCVRIGPEAQRSRADALAADIRRLTGLKPIIRKYNVD